MLDVSNYGKEEVMAYDLIEWGRRRIIVEKITQPFEKPSFIAAAPMSRWKEIEMKGNSKKLAVLMIVAAFTLFMAVPITWADGLLWNKAIQGKYAFSGAGACLIGGNVGPNTWEGVYIFNYDGTGSMDALNRYVDTTPPSGTAGSAQVHWDFTYTVNGYKITFTYVPNSYVATYLNGPFKGLTLSHVDFSGTWDGGISPDGENLFVSFGVPLTLTIHDLGGLQAVCNGVHQGFRVFE